VVSALSDHAAPSDRFYLYTPADNSHPEVQRIRSRKNVEILTPPGAYNFMPTAWRTFGIAHHQTMKDLDVFHGLSQELPYRLPLKIKKVVTVHDLIFLRYPQFYQPLDVFIYKTKVIHACKMADRVVAISNQTRNDLIEFLNVDEKKIEVIYQGIHPIFGTPISADDVNQVKVRYGLPSQYLLSVGTIEARKNLISVIKAIALLPESKRIPLVVVGRKTEYYNEVHNLVARSGLQNKIHFLDNARFSDFPALYSGAKIFIYPSLFEGFGIPLVEAISCGVPVITSQGSCFSEAAGPDSLYINPNDSAALSVAIASLLDDPARSSAIVRNSREFIKRFDPSVIAADLKALYASL
jgi:glycosyltransferase involved in cell wall biosynthesis